MKPKKHSLFPTTAGRYPTIRVQGRWMPPGSTVDAASPMAEAKKMTVFIDVAYRPNDGSIWALFISGGKDGTGLKSWMEDTGILLSKALQRGANAEALLKTLAGGDESLGAFALRTAIEEGKKQ